MGKKRRRGIRRVDNQSVVLDDSNSVASINDNKEPKFSSSRYTVGGIKVKGRGFKKLGKVTGYKGKPENFIENYNPRMKKMIEETKKASNQKKTDRELDEELDEYLKKRENAIKKKAEDREDYVSDSFSNVGPDNSFDGQDLLHLPNLPTSEVAAYEGK